MCEKKWLISHITFFRLLNVYYGKFQHTPSKENNIMNSHLHTSQLQQLSIIKACLVSSIAPALHHHQSKVLWQKKPQLLHCFINKYFSLYFQKKHIISNASRISSNVPSVLKQLNRQQEKFYYFLVYSWFIQFLILDFFSPCLSSIFSFFEKNMSFVLEKFLHSGFCWLHLYCVL